MSRLALFTLGLWIASLVLAASSSLAQDADDPAAAPASQPATPLLRPRPGSLLTPIGPLLLFIGMGGTAFVEQKLHQAMIQNNRLRWWQVGRNELYGIIVGCPFFAFIMASAMFLPVYLTLPTDAMPSIPIMGWVLASAGLFNGIVTAGVLLWLTRAGQPNHLRYAAVAAIALNSLAMAGHVYFLFVNPALLHARIRPEEATAILWAMGLTSLLLLLLTGREGAAAAMRLFHIDWDDARLQAARISWAAAALLGLVINLAVLPVWQFRSRLPARIPWLFTYAPAALFAASWLLWRLGNRSAPEHRLLARLAALALFAAATQLFLLSV